MVNRKYFHLLQLFVVGFIATRAVASSTAAPIAYDAILALVIIEVVFAFSVGIICIVFSFNLLRALKDVPTEQMDRLSVGNLPPSRPTQQGRAGSVDSNTGLLPRASNTRHPSQDSEMDSEVQLPGYEPPPPESIFETFASYLRWW